MSWRVQKGEVWELTIGGKLVILLIIDVGPQPRCMTLASEHDWFPVSATRPWPGGAFNQAKRLL